MPVALSIAALLITCMATLELLVLGELLVPPFAVAALLFLLSYAAQRWKRPAAVAVLALAGVIPLGALAGHLRGGLVVAVPIFDAAPFVWLSWTALPHATASEEAH